MEDGGVGFFAAAGEVGVRLWTELTVGFDV